MVNGNDTPLGPPRQRGGSAILHHVPPPALTVHLLVPSADGTGLLAVDASVPAALPAFTPQIGPADRLVTAVQRHLREAWALDPAILETHLPPPASHEDGYVSLAVLEPPPRGWRPPATLTWASIDPWLNEPIAPRARTWLAEWATGAEPPALRPRWSRPGWTARALGWIDEQLRRSGRQRIGPMTLWRLWSLSAMMRVPTQAGDAWFKAVFPHFHHEPGVTALLGSWLPDLVPPVIASDPDEGWLLLEAAGAPVARDADGDAAILGAVDRLAAAQQLTRGHLSELSVLGCPRRPLSGLAAALADALSEWEVLGGLAMPPRRAERVVDWVRERAAWLDGLAMGEVLVHGDFHPGNLLVGHDGTTIIDWSDASIAHPAVEIGAWFGEVRAELRPRGWEAWLAALARFGSVDELRGEEDAAYAVACAYQVVSYAGILRGVEPANRYQLSDGLNGYWHDLDARVP